LLLGYKNKSELAWWCMPVISALGRWRQEDCEFKTSLEYIMRPCLSGKIKNQTTNKNKKSLISYTYMYT
jgi:hypothetical protein